MLFYLFFFGVVVFPPRTFFFIFLLLFSFSFFWAGVEIQQKNNKNCREKRPKWQDLGGSGSVFRTSPKHRKTLKNIEKH